MKVFSFVASCAGERSHTAKFSDMTAERLAVYAEKCGETIEYERITGEHIKLDFCRSCENCFDRGICPLDERDDMALVKQKLLEADIILFCSPVYIGSMSGLMKCALDRLSYWTHRYELAGKTAAVLVTTSNNHGLETVSSIEEAVRSFGVSLAYSGCVYRHGEEPSLSKEQDMDRVLDEICSRLMDCVAQPDKYIDQKQNLGFYMSNKMRRQSRALADLVGGEPANEVLVCEQRGILRFNTLSQYVKAMRTEKKAGLMEPVIERSKNETVSK